MENEDNLIEFPRAVNQELFYYILGSFYDNYDSPLENDIFAMSDYDWSEPDNPKANFYHKASGFKLWWYKYPLRSPEVNMNITSEQFRAILYDCRNSLGIGGKHHIEKWWLKGENYDE